MKRLVLLLMLMVLVSGVLISSSFAETYSQKGKIFSIDIPDGWQCNEEMTPMGFGEPESQHQQLIIRSHEEETGLVIIFKKMNSNELTKKVFKNKFRLLKEASIYSLGRKVIEEKKININGIEAKQIDYIFPEKYPLVPDKGGFPQGIFVVFFNEEYIFYISIMSELEEERLKLMSIVETLKFL